jgi:benzoate-CoA ligase family protein
MSGPTLNIADAFLIDRLRDGNGDRTAIRLDDRTLNYREVAGITAGLAARLVEHGVQPEQRVLIGLPDGPEFVGALFGTLAIGAVAVMIGPEMRPEHLAAVVTASRSPLAVVAPDDRVRFETAGIPAVLVVNDTPPASPERFETYPTHRDDAAIWLFSGGTTGVPKIVVQTHRSFLNTTERYAHEALGYRADDITLSVPKLYFGYATGSNLLFPFSVGASAVLFPERPTPAVLFEQIRRHRPTILVNVPSMVATMVADPEADSQDFSSLRFATSAGEALPVELHRQWDDIFGIPLLDGLGTAEMWHVFVSNLPGEVRHGTVGRVVPGFDVRICDEDAVEVPDGEVGRLWVRGGSRAWGYWQDIDRTAEAFRGEWFVGGDLASRDRDGFITHRGRADDAVKVKGKWLRPQEVEGALLTHPAVRECAVIAIENSVGLLEPVAFVVAEDSPGLEEELQNHVVDRLEPYKTPRRVIVVDSLPQTHLGKTDRGALRRLATPPQ